MIKKALSDFIATGGIVFSQTHGILHLRYASMFPLGFYYEFYNCSVTSKEKYENSYCKSK